MCRKSNLSNKKSSRDIIIFWKTKSTQFSNKFRQESFLFRGLSSESSSVQPKDRKRVVAPPIHPVAEPARQHARSGHKTRSEFTQLTQKFSRSPWEWSVVGESLQSFNFLPCVWTFQLQCSSVLFLTIPYRGLQPVRSLCSEKFLFFMAPKDSLYCTVSREF